MSLDIAHIITAHNTAVQSVAALSADLHRCIDKIRLTLQLGGKLLACGNGGSAADAQHFAAELTGRYQADRRGYPAIALTTDTSALTSISNDYGYDLVFRRQLEALGRQGDLLIAISTSGESRNVIKAVELARERGIYSVGLLGKDGGKLRSLVDLPLVVHASHTARIQEAHILILHILCEALEN